MPNNRRGFGRATPGSEWRSIRELGVPIELPSGMIANLRPVRPDRLAAQGEVLDILTPLVHKMLFEGADASADLIAEAIGETIEPKSTDPADMRQAIGNLANIERVCDIVCKAAFVSPVIVDDPRGDDEISLEDLDLPDKVHVFTLALRGAAALNHFRYEPQADVEPVPDSEGDAQPAI